MFRNQPFQAGIRRRRTWRRRRWRGSRTLRSTRSPWSRRPCSSGAYGAAAAVAEAAGFGFFALLCLDHIEYSSFEIANARQQGADLFFVLAAGASRGMPFLLEN